MNKDFTGEDLLAAEEKHLLSCLFVCLYSCCIYYTQLFGGAVVHTERKGAGSEAGIISPSLMVLEAERCVFH